MYYIVFHNVILYYICNYQVLLLFDYCFIHSDINECETAGTCGDICENNIGGHECRCHDNRIAVDTQNCRGNVQ